MDMAQNELAATVAAPAPVPAPIPAPAPATIPVALTGWSLSTIAELEAAGVNEVSADPPKLVYMPAPVPMRALPPIMALAPVRLAAPAAPLHPPRRRSPCVWLHPPRPCPYPCKRPPQRHGTLPSTATSQRRQLSSSCAPPVDCATT